LWQKECRRPPEGSGSGGPSRGGVFGRSSREPEEEALPGHNSTWVAANDRVTAAAAADQKHNSRVVAWQPAAPLPAPAGAGQQVTPVAG
jgi:hypothetical protein